ncbi:coiled-coil domain-containing protein [Streptomyces litchfieldiae]|uniref:Integral membrane protein n=1 Tax=Streptomyces litchfieldiae TaxID=3075543 RepID=A0ABU2MNA1_9ACTN|nr:hypothetical protein [Streptomyces sp. DSM 44938]MDT0343098.1 hypothetical protein [Streptomyces sp. DSM 44938]
MSYPREPHIDDFPALGFVPCPGDQTSMDSVADTFGRTTEVLAEVNAVLTGAEEGEWRGRTAREFRRMLREDFQPKVEDALQSFEQARRAITDWVVTMGDYQRRAEVIETHAAEAQRARDAALAGLEALPDEPGPFDPEPETDEERREQERNEQARGEQESALRIADAALQEFRDRARALQDEFNDSGRSTAGRLANAIDLAPNEPGLWESLGDAIGDFAQGIADLVDDLGAALIDVLAEWAPILSKIGAVAGLLSTITGLLALLPIPGLQFLGVVSLVLAGVSTLANYGAAVGETGSFTAALADPAFLLSAASLAFGVGSFVGLAKLSAMGATQSFRGVPHVFGWAMRNGSSAAGLPGVMALTYATNANTAGLRFMDGFGNAGTVMDPGSLFTGWSRNTSPVRTG